MIKIKPLLIFRFSKKEEEEEISKQRPTGGNYSRSFAFTKNSFFLFRQDFIPQNLLWPFVILRNPHTTENQCFWAGLLYCARCYAFCFVFFGAGSFNSEK